MKANDPRLEALHRHAEGIASAEDVALLEQAVLNDAEFRAFMIEYLHVDAAMVEFAQDQALHISTTMPEASQPVARRRSGERAQTPRRADKPAHPGGMPVRWFIPAAAAAALIISTSLWFMRGSEGIEVEVLRVANAGLRAGDKLKLSALSLAQGEAQVRLPSDVKLTLSGAGEVRFIDSMHARVLSGKVTVDVGDRGKGFVLDTPQTRVVDLGTQFGVEARGDGLTDVMVIEGKIELHDDQRVTPLEQGEALRVDAQRRQQRIVSITGGALPSDWSTGAPSKECSIASVADNFEPVEDYHFYRILPLGLAPGTASYVNRTQVWGAADGKAFPSALTNADLVQTFRGARKRQTYEMRVTLKRPCMLYVLMPKSVSTPGWLARDFTRTADELTLRNGDVHSRIQIPCEVWQRTITEPGSVTLGSAPREVKGSNAAMYGVAARPL